MLLESTQPYLLIKPIGAQATIIHLYQLDWAKQTSKLVVPASLSFCSKRSNRFILNPPSKYWVSLHRYKDHLGERKHCHGALESGSQTPVSDVPVLSGIGLWKERERGHHRKTSAVSSGDLSCERLAIWTVLNKKPSTDLQYQLSGRMHPISHNCLACIPLRSQWGGQVIVAAPRHGRPRPHWGQRPGVIPLRTFEKVFSHTEWVQPWTNRTATLLGPQNTAHCNNCIYGYKRTKDLMAHVIWQI